MASLTEMGTWEVMPLPKGRKPVDCKWIFKYKYSEDGVVNQYKARLVAKGFSQQYGISYLETFAPVIWLNTLRAILAYGVQQNMKIHQIDGVSEWKT